MTGSAISAMAFNFSTLNTCSSTVYYNCGLKFTISPSRLSINFILFLATGSLLRNKQKSKGGEHISVSRQNEKASNLKIKGFLNVLILIMRTGRDFVKVA